MFLQIVGASVFGVCLYCYFKPPFNLLINESTVSKINNKYYTKMYYKGKEYSTRVNIVRTPQTVFIEGVYDMNNNDVKDNVLKFLGPNYSFIKESNLTPHDLGYSELNIHFVDDDGNRNLLTLKENDVILF